MTKLKKLIFVGDSHVAMIKQAVDMEKDLGAAASFDFLVQAFTKELNLGHMECESDYCWARSLVARVPLKTARGADRFYPDAYDAVVLVGLRTELPYALWDGYYWEPDAKEDGKLHLSADAYMCALRDVIEQQSIAVAVARKIRSISRCPMLLLPNPYIDAGLRNTRIWPPREGVSDRKISASRIRNEQANLSSWKTALREALSPYNVEILFQLEQTTTDSIFTRSDYSRGQSKQFDMRHMTAKYGRVIIDQVLRAV